MPHHEWGDEWFEKHDIELNSAIRLFTSVNSLLRGHVFFTKEKYGTMRLEAFFGLTSLDAWLLRKNCIFIHYPRIHKISKIIDIFLRASYLDKLIFKYQNLIFNIATLVTIAKYSIVKREIMNEPQFADLLYNWVKGLTGYINYWEQM